MLNIIDKIKSFEIKLDHFLNNLKILKCNGNEVIRLCGELYENLYISGNPNARTIEAGFYILLPYLLRQDTRDFLTKLDHKEIMNELLFASHYDILRDYLYYTYNTEKSLEWIFEKNKVKIRILDSSIPRQYFIEENNYLLNSRELGTQLEDQSKEILSLLKGSPEFELSENYPEVHDLIHNEILLKFKYLHNFVDSTSEIDLGIYTYQQFITIYSEIMFLALYNRYYAKANDLKTLTLIYPLKKLINTFTKFFGLSEKVCKALLFDLAYSKDKIRQDSNNFPLIYFEESEELLMIPSIVARSDGFINILRIWAKRNPKIFLQLFSEKIGTNFEHFISKIFEEKDFTVFKDIKLNKIQEDLPDIDLLILSKEPTLGFHIYIIEVKNPIPAAWGKYYLKALGKKGFIRKAFKQLKKVESFLESEKGSYLIMYLIMNTFKNWSKEFSGGFVTAIEFLIVSSQNTGMFFTQDNKTVIDYKSLRRIVKKSDGDVVYINRSLKTLIEDSNNCYTVQFQNFELDSISVEYEVAMLKYLFDFPDHKYKSIEIDKEIAEEGRKAGYNFINTIDENFIEKFTKDGGKFIATSLGDYHSEDEKKNYGRY